MVNVFEKRIGYIFSEDGLYEPHMITFTVEVNERVEIGDIVCIRHPSRRDIPVFYQVVEVPVRRKARDYEEDLARLGQPLIDESRNYPRARAKQIGYVEDLDKLLRGESSLDDLVMLIEHIKPLSEVYRPSDQVIDSLLKPSEPCIVVGDIYPSWKHKYYLSLPRLLRQGLLVVGGVGTGKTTTMLTIIYRVVEEVMGMGGKPHVVIIDKDGEYGSRELIDLVGQNNYIHIHVDDIGRLEYFDSKTYTNELLKALGYTDRRSRAAKAVEHAVQEYREGSYMLTPEFFEEKILPIIKSKYRDSYPEIVSKLSRWKKESGGVETGATAISINDLLEIIKKHVITHIDLSTTRDYDHAYRVLRALLKIIYDEALRNPSFGCIVAIDEAHLFAPEARGISLTENEDLIKGLRGIIHLIATTGARNGVALFIATQRPSLISKTITTQMGQNIIAHRVEDVDLERIAEIMGPVARRVTVLPRGWAIVKALASKIREPMIVRVKPETYPTSTGRTAYDRFIAGSEESQ